MKIHGKEVQFLRTVKATSDIASLCPEKDIERIDELFNGDLPTTLETGAKIIHFLNEGFEMNKHFEDPTYQPNILSIEEIMYLDDATYTELMKCTMSGMNNGADTSIEVETSKKKEEKTQG